MRTKTMFTTIAISLLLATPSGLAVKDEGDPGGGSSDDQCNFETTVQVTVTGDNETSCQAQHCVNGGAGAGSAGAGVGTGASKGEASASASAGTGCTQSSNKTSAFSPLGAW